MGRPPSCLCGACGKCRHREYMREWQKAHPGYAVASARRRRESGAVAEYERTRYQNDEEYRKRKKARNMILIRVARGTLVRQPCERCGVEPAEAHHPNYDKPLEVVWLCRAHHVELHSVDPAKRIKKRLER